MPNKSTTAELTDLIKGAFIDYSAAVNYGRSFPDARDGLKPVQRCILYGLQRLGLTTPSKTGKVQKVASQVSGNWHPHGDAAAAAALFKLGQWWVMRYPLVYPDGNFGSPDENPASPRYPDTSLSAVGKYMVGDDLDPNVVSFRPNYDESDEVPMVLPSLFPNLLCNGQMGIGSAMAFESVPHNVCEVVDAIKTVAKKPKTTIRKLLSIIPGPDFPTGGVLYRKGTDGSDRVKEYYETGSASLSLRGRIHAIGANSSGTTTLVITELPYGVGRDQYIEDVRKHLEELEEIVGIVNLSGEETHIELEIKSGADPEDVMNKLFSMTKLETRISINNTFVDLSGDAPSIRKMTLREMLEAYIDHRINVIVSRSELRLTNCEERVVILSGFEKAIQSIDQVVEIVRKSNDRNDAIDNLCDTIGLNETQANAVLNMRISRLTTMAEEDVVDELDQLETEIKELQELLDDRDKRIGLMCDELDDMVEDIGDERRTTIIDTSTTDASLDDLSTDETVVFVSENREVIRRSAHEVQLGIASGAPLMSRRQAGKTIFAKVVEPSSRLAIVDDQGQIYTFDSLEIPTKSPDGDNVMLGDVCGIDEDDTIVMMTAFDPDDVNGRYVAVVTEMGYVKKTSLSEVASRRPSGRKVSSPDDNDKLLYAKICTDRDQMIIATAKNRVCRFEMAEIRPTGTTARGVYGMRVDNGSDRVVGAAIIPSGIGEVVFATKDGKFQRTSATTIRLTARDVQGVRVFDALGNDAIADVVHVPSNRDIRYTTNKKRCGVIAVADIPRSDEPVPGSRPIKLQKNVKVSRLWITSVE